MKSDFFRLGKNQFDQETIQMHKHEILQNSQQLDHGVLHLKIR